LGGAVIFSGELYEKVYRGEKTVTRRCGRNDDWHCPYKAGHDYSIQRGRSKPGDPDRRILVTSVRQRPGRLDARGAAHLGRAGQRRAGVGA
jgi:hypothetical protein